MFIDDWTTPAFLEGAASWVAAVCDRHAIVPAGDREQVQCRPWSTVIRFGSDAGPLWFKANGTGSRHEGALTAALAKLEPDLVPVVAGFDEERGWWLSRDAGPVLRTRLEASERWPIWEEVLPRYGRAQLRLAASGPALNTMGLPEVSPANLPGLAASLIAELGSLESAVGGLTSTEHGALLAALPAFNDSCATLLAAGIPSTVQHDDLHSANVCLDLEGKSARVIDWGDASFGHPFGTLLVTLNAIAHEAGVDLESPSVTRIRDAYLDAFTAFGDRRSLLDALACARQTGVVTRALSWRTALQDAPAATGAEFDFPIRGWLLELLGS